MSGSFADLLRVEPGTRPDLAAIDPGVIQALDAGGKDGLIRR